MGPVQVLVIAFDEPTFSGEVLAELTKLREAGIVRLIDLLVVKRDVDGTIETLDAPPGAEAGSGSLAAVVLGQGEGDEAVDDESPTWSLADAIPAGSAAAVALIEHLWAAPLSDAIRTAGGTVVEETWLAPSDREALEALMSGR
jgi:uncharacterized membrane protein